MRFSVSVSTQGGLAGAGPVRGRVNGSHIRPPQRHRPHDSPLARPLRLARAAGPDTLTATLGRTFDRGGLSLLFTGIVDEGHLRGVEIVVAATRSDLADGHDRGTSHIHQD